MPNGADKNPDYPFRVFVSHKVSGHGNAAVSIKHRLELLSPDKLRIFVSPALGPGEVWRDKLREEIESADLFVLLYLVQGLDMDWCLYEAGYFEREALKTGRKLICVTNPGFFLPGPLVNRQRLEANEDGIENLLRAILSDEKKPVREDLFDRRQEEDLDALIKFIITTLGPVEKIPLSPRLWIKFQGEDELKKILSGSLPGNIQLEGESEALKEFGVGLGAGITLKKFYEESEFKHTLDRYIPHVMNCIRRIINRKSDLWVIPPVRVVKGGQPKVLVPAYFEEGLGKKYTFEFIVYQPRPDYRVDADSSFGTLYNVFVLSWHFRRLIIEEWFETFMNLKSLGPRLGDEEISRSFRNFKLAMGSVLLDSLNRNLDSPRRIEIHFEKKEDREKLRRIMNLEDGLWMTQSSRLDSGLETGDVDKVLESLCELKNLNKTLMVMTLKRLLELAMEKDGDLI